MIFFFFEVQDFAPELYTDFPKRERGLWNEEESREMILFEVWNSSNALDGFFYEKEDLDEEKVGRLVFL